MMGMKVKLPSLDLLFNPKGAKVCSDAIHHHSIFNALYLLDPSAEDTHIICNHDDNTESVLLSQLGTRSAATTTTTTSGISSSSLPSSSVLSLTTDSEPDEQNDINDDDLYDPLIEDVIRRTQSDTRRRLIYKPEETSSILVVLDHKSKQQQQRMKDHMMDDDEDEEGIIMAAADGDQTGSSEQEQVVVMAMQSEDPYLDFRMSMEEMLETHKMLLDEVDDYQWDRLEELLGWYLSVNGKSNHGYIVGAFVDLIINKFASTSISS